MRFGRVQKATYLKTRFWRASSIDFSLILEVFWGCVFDVFLDRRILCVVNANVQNHCTFSTQPARHASFFYTDEFWISFRILDKKLRKCVKNEFRFRNRVRYHFGEDFGSIWGQFWRPWGPEIIKSRFWKASESSLHFRYDLDTILVAKRGLRRLCPVGPAAGAGPV